MRFNINLPFDYELEFSTNARWGWNHFKIHRYDTYNHIVWGKISIIWGQPDLMEEYTCDYCLEPAQMIGEDGIDYCESCGIIEGHASQRTYKELRELGVDL